MDEDLYFRKFLKVAPLSLAIWRSIEAYQLAKQKIKYKRPILDIGCGFGEFAGVFFNGKIEVGIDIDGEELLRARQTKKFKKLIIADARKLPFKNNSFNTVFSNSVLEHITNVEKVISESYRVLKPKGYFIFTVPINNFYNNLYFTSLFKKIGFPFVSHYYFRYINKIFKHINIWPKNKWLTLTKKAGFKIILEKEIISKKSTRIFDLTILSAFLSQLGRWLTGKRFIINLPGRIWLSEKLFGKLITEEPTTGSNLLIIAMKKYQITKTLKYEIK